MIYYFNRQRVHARSVFVVNINTIFTLPTSYDRDECIGWTTIKFLQRFDDDFNLKRFLKSIRIGFLKTE